MAWSTCQHCGTRLPGGLRYCPNCHQPIADILPKPSEPLPPITPSSADYSTADLSPEELSSLWAASSDLPSLNPSSTVEPETPSLIPSMDPEQRTPPASDYSFLYDTNPVPPSAAPTTSEPTSTSAEPETTDYDRWDFKPTPEPIPTPVEPDTSAPRRSFRNESTLKFKASPSDYEYMYGTAPTASRAEPQSEYDTTGAINHALASMTPNYQDPRTKSRGERKLEGFGGSVQQDFYDDSAYAAPGVAEPIPDVPARRAPSRDNPYGNTKLPYRSPPSPLDQRPPMDSPFAVVRTGGLFWSLILLLVPVVGLVVALIWSCGAAKRIWRRNLANALLIIKLTLLLLIVLGVLGLRLMWAQNLPDIPAQLDPSSQYTQVFEILGFQVGENVPSSSSQEESVSGEETADPSSASSQLSESSQPSSSQSSSENSASFDTTGIRENADTVLTENGIPLEMLLKGGLSVEDINLIVDFLATDDEGRRAMGMDDAKIAEFQAYVDLLRSLADEQG